MIMKGFVEVTCNTVFVLRKCNNIMIILTIECNICMEILLALVCSGIVHERINNFIIFFHQASHCKFYQSVTGKNL